MKIYIKGLVLLAIIEIFLSRQIDVFKYLIIEKKS